eukprot:scaffold12091_cov69-Phaeocystis_antarctica.AAC.5
MHHTRAAPALLRLRRRRTKPTGRRRLVVPRPALRPRALLLAGHLTRIACARLAQGARGGRLAALGAGLGRLGRAAALWLGGLGAALGLWLQLLVACPPLADLVGDSPRAAAAALVVAAA